MLSNEDLNPFENEMPADYAARLGVVYSKAASKEHKKEKGQFFTPNEIASFMADQAFISKDRIIDVLDPGCGVGILSCSLLTKLSEGEIIDIIHLVVYEADTFVLPYTIKSLDYLKIWLQSHGVALTYEIRNCDFVIDILNQINLSQLDAYNYIISNPPYFKLIKDYKKLLGTKTDLAKDHTNIYSLFMALSIRLLKTDAELIFIVPRSFASGSYFKAFREDLYAQVELTFVHLFDSRRDPFGKDSVLQELLILKAFKSKRSGQSGTGLLTVSTSYGLKDLDNSQCKTYEIGQLVDFNSREKILHLPVNDVDEAVIALFKSWPDNLSSFGIQVSTGPVVSFRSRNSIFKEQAPGLTSLFWLHNVQKMQMEWPVNINGKGQFVEISPETKSILLPNQNYVLLRRFSSKDDKSRLVAAPYFVQTGGDSLIGVENKLNYIYRPNGTLNQNEVMGLAALLNSSLFDTYFRTFNGNVNVSATELREMRFPPLEQIIALGDSLIAQNNFNAEFTNRIVRDLFNLENILI